MSQKTENSDRPIQPMQLVLCLLSLLATVTYLLYYQSKAAETNEVHVTSVPEYSKNSRGRNPEKLTDEEFVAAALHWERERIATRKAAKEMKIVRSNFVEGAGYREYTMQLEEDLRQIDLDQMGLRQPILERLEQAESDSGEKHFQLD
jgi:hypothetical protein